MVSQFYGFCTYDDDVCNVFRALSKGHRPWNRTRDCRTSDVFRLSAAQRDLCTQYLDLMPAVTRAAKTTSDVCQQLFADKRWNCSSVLLAPRFTPDLTGGLTMVTSLIAVLLMGTRKIISRGVDTCSPSLPYPFFSSPSLTHLAPCGFRGPSLVSL